MNPEARRWGLLLLGGGVVIVVFGVLPTHQFLYAIAGEEESPSAAAGHFAEFAVFALFAGLWLSARSSATGMSKTILLALGMTAALGGAIEIMQGPLPYRDMQFSDLATDVAGGLAGLTAFSFVRMRSAWEGRRRTG